MFCLEERRLGVGAMRDSRRPVGESQSDRGLFLLLVPIGTHSPPQGVWMGFFFLERRSGDHITKGSESGRVITWGRGLALGEHFRCAPIFCES